MRDEFLSLRRILREGQVPHDSSRFEDPTHRRLIKAIAQHVDRGMPGPADLLALVGHVLRREEALGREDVWLSVPTGRGATSPLVWPDIEDWRRASFAALNDGASVKIRPSSWEPAWLTSPATMLAEPLFAEEYRRTYEPVAGDPFLAAVQRTTYRCDAQREAVRAIVAAPDGATITVNLPTGAGKSLCAQLPALLLSERGGTTIVIVPTTALALDQQRALRHLIPHATAYIGGAGPDDEEQRALIRARVRDGSQRVVFTSPESLLQSLRPAVYAAARSGLMRLFVIDEAHMVEQWGNEFRSSFQEIAGIRADLLRTLPPDSPPFTTLLLTATLTRSAHETLDALFGNPGPRVTVSAAQLRPEPSYWSVHVAGSEEKEQVLMEAVQHLPRPAILYVTEPKEAMDWADRLRHQGYWRTDVVSGQTPNSVRTQVIERWRQGDTDIVVATSAFGLGIDQEDVRVVIHATVPENIDRYYQEVGRGGRDGNACASLVIYTDEDLRRAASMNRTKIIGIERGRERWSSMFDVRAKLPNGRLRVPIDVRPNLTDGIDMDNELNRAWNVRTLTLMARAGLLDFDAEPPPAADSASGLQLAAGAIAGSLSDYGALVEEQARHRVVRLRSDATLTQRVWETTVEPVRQRTAAADELSHRLMRDVLEGDRCVAEILSDAYSIDGHNGEFSTPVAASCGGCNYCRANGRRPFAAPLPTPFPRWPVVSTEGEQLSELRRGSGLAVFYGHVPQERDLTRLVRWLVAQGVRIIAAPDAVLTALAPALYTPAAARSWAFTYSLDNFRLIRAPALPSMIYLPPGACLAPHLRKAFDGEKMSVARVLIAPENTRDTSAPDRLLRSALQCPTFDLRELSMRLGL